MCSHFVAAVNNLVWPRYFYNQECFRSRSTSLHIVYLLCLVRSDTYINRTVSDTMKNSCSYNMWHTLFSTGSVIQISTVLIQNFTFLAAICYREDVSLGGRVQQRAHKANSSQACRWPVFKLLMELMLSSVGWSATSAACHFTRWKWRWVPAKEEKLLGWMFCTLFFSDEWNRVFCQPGCQSLVLSNHFSPLHTLIFTCVWSEFLPV